jgi:hypothetical protein
MYQNNVFLNHFYINISKRFKNIKKLFLSKKIKFLQTLFGTQFQTTPKYLCSLNMIREYLSVVMIAFQNIFCLKMYQNNIFYFLKNIFDISTSKR